MGLLDAVTSPLDTLSELAGSPFPVNVKKKIIPNDFEDGFVITEILPSGKEGYVVKLKNSFAPLVPFEFGGKARQSKEFYAGRNEPTVQVMGTEEDDLVIKGRLREKKFTEEFAGIVQEYQELLDAIRLRQNIVKMQMGEFLRYGLISASKFTMSRKNKIDYEVKFLIIGFEIPTNAVYLSNNKELPYDLNADLIEAGANFVPDDAGVPFDIIDQLNFLIDDVARAIGNVTGFVDSALKTIDDLEQAIFKATLLIKSTQNKLNNYKRRLGGFDMSNPIYSLSQKNTARTYTNQSMRNAVNLTSILEKMRSRFNSIILRVPLARHVVKDGDTLQKISTKYYGTADNWSKVQNSNNLESSDLTIGTTLEIPRV